MNSDSSSETEMPEEEVVEMKCLLCLYEEAMEADMLLEYAETNNMFFPQVKCPRCGYESFVPKDVFPALYVPGPSPLDKNEKKKHLGRPKKKR